MKQTPRSQSSLWRLFHGRAFRVAKAKYAASVEVLLSGEGAREWGGRFNSPGVRGVLFDNAFLGCIGNPGSRTKDAAIAGVSLP